MKKLFSTIAILVLVSMTASAKTQFVLCTKDESSVALIVSEALVESAFISGWLEYKIDDPDPVAVAQDGTIQYEFIVNDTNDTNTYFRMYLLNGRIVKKELLQNGNDTDNQKLSVIAEGDEAFTCIWK